VEEERDTVVSQPARTWRNIFHVEYSTPLNGGACEWFVALDEVVADLDLLSLSQEGKSSAGCDIGSVREQTSGCEASLPRSNS